MCGCHLSATSPNPTTRDLACNPGMCPDWESNQRPFGLQSSTQSTEPHQPGHSNISWYPLCAECFKYIISFNQKNPNPLVLDIVIPILHEIIEACKEE